MRKTLIIFTRYPQPGQAKTRLIPCLGPEGAARLQTQMTEHLLATVAPLLSRNSLDLEVRYTGGNRDFLEAWLGPQYRYVDQGNGDLGQRMHRACVDNLKGPGDRAIIVGTDCPDLTCDLVVEAYRALETHDVVFGPAHDGGYYLVGLNRPTPALFSDVTWGSETVLERSRQHAATAALSVAQLIPLTDVDRPEDLPVWTRVRKPFGAEEDRLDGTHRHAPHGSFRELRRDGELAGGRAIHSRTTRSTV